MISPAQLRREPSIHPAQWLIARSEEAAELYRRLEQMADDAGFVHRERGWAVDALEANAEVDRLLATLDDWQDAAEAIRLEVEKDYAFQQLLRICRAVIARAILGSVSPNGHRSPWRADEDRQASAIGETT